MTSQQTTTVLQWINTILQPQKITVTSLQELSNGYVLCLIAEEISGKKIEKKMSKPVHPAHKVSNATHALDIFKQYVQIIGCTANDIFDGNEKLMLAILVKLMKFHESKGLKNDDQEKVPSLGLTRSQSIMTMGENKTEIKSPKKEAPSTKESDDSIKLKKQIEELIALNIGLNDEKLKLLNDLDLKKEELGIVGVELEEKKALELKQVEAIQVLEEKVSQLETKSNSDSIEAGRKIEEILGLNTELTHKLQLLEIEKVELSSKLQNKELDGETKALIQSLNDRVEKYAEGIAKIQENYFTEIERLGAVREKDLAALKEEYEEKMTQQHQELDEEWEDKMNELSTQHLQEIETLTQEYQNRESGLLLSNDLLKNPDLFPQGLTTNRSSQDDLKKRLSTGPGGKISEKAQKMLIGNGNKDSPSKDSPRRQKK